MPEDKEFLDDEAWALWGELEDLESDVSYDQVEVIRLALVEAYNAGYVNGRKAVAG